jgi:hypothetical protein
VRGVHDLGLGVQPGAGETIGVLRAGRREAGQPCTPAESRQLAGLAGQVAAAGHAVALTRDLRRSRERLVAAAEEERRRTASRWRR